jgi:large subunit ribosomal protein L10
MSRCGFFWNEAMSRQVKDLVISDIQNRIGSARDFVVVDCSKLDAITANKWRLGLRKDRIHALTVKNSVALNALSRKGITGLDRVLSGPSTLIWGADDVVGLSRAVARWAKEMPKLEIKGATVEGQALDASGVETLSKSAGRLETIGELAGLMLAPGRQLAGCLQGPGGQLAGAIKTIADKE